MGGVQTRMANGHSAVVQLAAIGRGVCRRAADGVFIAWTDGDDFTGGVVELAIDESEPLCPLTWYVELDVREPSQVSADVSVAEFLAGH